MNPTMNNEGMNAETIALLVILWLAWLVVVLFIERKHK